jgi:hypothetical protein
MLYNIVSLRELAKRENLLFCDEPDAYQEINLYDDYHKTTTKWDDLVKAKATGYLKLENASVLSNGCIAYKNYIIVDGVRFIVSDWKKNPIQHCFYSSYFTNFNSQEDTVEVNKDLIVEKLIDDTYVNLSSVISQIGHLMFDTLPQSFWYEKIPCKNIIMKEAFSSTKKPVEYLIDCFFPHESKITYPGHANTWFTFKELYVIEQPMRRIDESEDFYIDRKNIERCKSRVENIVASNRALNYPENIFLTRNDANNKGGRSNIINNNELISTIERYNFKIITLSDVTWEEQIKLFANAKNICAIHGAGIANILLSNSNCNVIEIDYYNNPIFNLFANCYSLKYHRCKTIVDRDEAGEERMTIDISQLEDIIKFCQTE